MNVWKVEADYLEQVLPEYRDNPLIEALPDIMSDDETIAALTNTPTYSEEERNLDAKYRIHCLSRLLHDYYQPLPQHLDIEKRISVCIRQGYRNRNPAGKEYALMANESYEAMKEGRYPRPVAGYHPHASGFTIIGVSGVGKSTAVESVLAQYPQLIEHREYHGKPLPLKQITWLKLDCPHDGSRIEMCYRFFKSVDDVIGSDYLDQYKKSRTSVGAMLTLMQRIAQEYSLGLLVADEVQHLAQAKSGSDAMLNFFVTLVNTIGVPVILIGTSKALPILQGQFRQARRSSGHGDLIWNRMKKERTWTVFVESIWSYQWIQNRVPLTPEMLDVIYQETQGIIVLAVVLYVLLQEDAIITEQETFRAEDIRRVSKERMALVQPMLEALRNNDQKNIDKYEDITDILVDEVSSRLASYQDQDLPRSSKTAGAASLAKLRNEILPFFIKLHKPPELVDRLIEQAYQKTKSTDTAAIMEMVYDKLKKEEEATGKGRKEQKDAPKFDHKEIAGQVDDTLW